MNAVVERIVDLDRAAERIAARAVRWRAAGLTVGALTWRDALAPWPQPLETDRARVTDPDSVGVQVVDPLSGGELHVVLFRGGWADVEYLAAGWEEQEDAEVGVIPANDFTGAADFDERLRGWMAHVFG
ncbi:hypothetical protein ACFVTF_38475 [Kitasatospora sp. NPDC057940]|uniref:hypothetical protein n=1 Tax=unclassified Kitasatospora TaxID=2633591 RepID=UPI00352E6267|nr:hypothetical protein OG556_27485 [Kitasatospora sp. NBC_01300]